MPRQDDDQCVSSIAGNELWVPMQVFGMCRQLTCNFKFLKDDCNG